MYKKIVAIVLCLLLFITGCTTKPSVDKYEEENTVNSNVGEVSLVWKENINYSNIEVEYLPTKYSSRVPNYSVSSNLANLANIDRFSGFSKDQRSKLIKNGFVVLEPNPNNPYLYRNLYDIYENNEYKNIPSFITVDLALHLYHKFFDETLKRLEKEKLSEALQELTSNMLNKSLHLYSQDSNEVIKDELKDIIIYFAVANKLINDDFGNIPKEYIAIAEAEVEEIQKAEGYTYSQLFKFDINYGQFTVRGHYTGDEILDKYFRTMMWYGLIGNPFKDRDDNWDYDSISKALLITYLSYVELDGVDDIALWDKIYAPTNFFVGNSDDINIMQMKEIILKVYGEDVKPSDFKKKASYEKLTEELNKLPDPQIKLRLTTGAVNTPTGKQFRFMGQRYTLDANIMQELMFPIIRPFPTGLDVVAAFGNPRGEELAKEYYLDKLDPIDYSIELVKMKDKVNSIKETEWRQNLYNGWLWVLKSVWTPIKSTEGLPFFMKNSVWQDKNIQTGLGSYGELKHDTVLYAKQPMAERGGGEEPPEILNNYVEPAVEVYERLLWLIQYSKVNLEKRELLNDESINAINMIENLYKLLVSCSVKQLENTPISEEENFSLKLVGGTVEHIMNLLAENYAKNVSSAVISDVAGMYLEIGTGLANEIYVVVYDQGKIYLSRGATYSYYEFVSDGPLTDEEWHKTIGIEKIQEGDWYYHQINPEQMKNAPPQPEWIKSFKTLDKNQVKISDIEYQVGN